MPSDHAAAHGQYYMPEVTWRIGSSATHPSSEMIGDVQQPVYTHEVNSTFGDCGAFLVQGDKVVGLHVAGSKTHNSYISLGTPSFLKVVFPGTDSAASSR